MARAVLFVYLFSCMKFLRLFETISDALEDLRADFAVAAQRAYDAWDVSSDPEDGDWQVGFGGICHLVADELASVAMRVGFEATTVSAQVGDQHVWAVVQTPDGVYEVDIPPHVYETGSGYQWKKIPGIRFGADHVVINRLDPDPTAFAKYMQEANQPIPTKGYPKGFRVTVKKVEDDLYDCVVWENGTPILSTSGTAFNYPGEARECGRRRAWDIHNGATQWS
jgi:hypothetical protein